MTSIKMREKLKKASRAYYNEEPIMTDDEYDILEERFRQTSPGDPYFAEVGAPPPVGTLSATRLWVKTPHEIPMGSLTKVKGPSGLQDWWDKTENQIRTA